MARLCFRENVHHINICADAAVHDTHNVLAVLAYSWENDAAAFGDFQYLRPDKIWLEEDMRDSLARLAVHYKQRRAAALKELQAISHAVFQLTKDRKEPLTIDSFVVPRV